MSSREDGFASADVDVRILSMPWARKLRAKYPKIARDAVLLALATQLTAWADGDRIQAIEADSPDVAATETLVTALIDVGFLDATGRIPLEEWRSWFVPAWDRREKKRAGGAEGNKRRWSDRHTDSQSSEHAESHSDSESVSPASPASPASPDRQASQDPLPPAARGNRGRRRRPSAASDRGRAYDALMVSGDVDPSKDEDDDGGPPTEFVPVTAGASLGPRCSRCGGPITNRAWSWDPGGTSKRHDECPRPVNGADLDEYVSFS